MSIEVNAARAGSTVLYIADHMDEAHAIIDREADDNAEQIASIRRTNGAEEIRYANGGRLRFASARSHGHRGISARVVSVSSERHANTEWMASVLPCMATQLDARLVIRGT